MGDHADLDSLFPARDNCVLIFCHKHDRWSRRQVVPVIRIRKIVKTKWAPALAIGMVAFILFASLNNEKNCNVAHASDTAPSDYCFQMDIQITYAGAPTLTNQSFRVPINALGLIAANQMDVRAWDILPIQGSLSNEVDVMAQDLGNTDAAFWVHFPTIVQDQTKTVRFYIGNNEQKRNQGVIFTGADTATVTDSALMDIADDLEIQIELELLDDTAQDAPLLTHYNGADGYRFLLFDDSSTLKLRAEVDTDTCDLTWDSLWTNTNQLFTMRFAAAAGNDLFIDRNGVNAAACDTDLASITAPAGTPSLETGTSMANAIIRDIGLLDTSVIVGRWGFDSRYITEDSAADPTFIGTIQDYGVNNLDMVYTFIRDQSDITGVVGSVQLTSAADEISLDKTTTDILGSPFGGTLENAGPAQVDENVFYVLFVEQFVAAMAVPASEEMGYVIAMTTYGIFLMVLVFKSTKYIPLALFLLVVPASVGVIKEWIEPWWMILWVILILGVWFSQRQQETA